MSEKEKREPPVEGQGETSQLPQKMMRRRIIREKVVQALYAYELSGDAMDHVIRTILTPLQDNELAYDFAKRLVIKTAEQRADFDKIIRGKLNNWDFKRVALLDRIILRMG